MDVPSSFPTWSPTQGDSNDESTKDRDEAIIVGAFSIFFYGFVCCIAAFYYHKFWQIEKENQNHSFNTGRYDHAKKLFFLILAISSFLELPTYFGCLAKNGPSDCSWDSGEFVFFYFLHSLASCGYACCIVIPCVLWSDMITKKDGKLFFSTFPVDATKRYFQVVIILYFLNNFVEILLDIIFFQPSDPTAFSGSIGYAISSLTESILILALSIGCLYCGIKLQMYVHDAKLDPSIELKFLFTLNIIMSIIVISFVGRALIVSTFAPGVPDSLQNLLEYPVFMLITRWIPDVFCQLCLVSIMRLSGSEIIMKNNAFLHSPAKKGHRGTGGIFSYFSPNHSKILRPLLSNDLDDEHSYQPDASKDLAKVQENFLPVFRVDNFHPVTTSHTHQTSNASSFEFRHEPFTSGGSDSHPFSSIQLAHTPPTDNLLHSMVSPTNHNDDDEGEYTFHDQRLLSL